MTKQDALDKFFAVALKGESKGYNDHNWYASGKLHSFIEANNKSGYPLLTKKLSEDTLGNIKKMQAHSRDNNGQLFAVGRYQMIPTTLSSAQSKLGITDTTIFDKPTQDLLAFQIMKNKGDLSNYINGKVSDTEDNLSQAVLDMAQIWSSIGVPFATKGHNKNVAKDESYYAPSDRASVKSDAVKSALRQLRKDLASSTDTPLAGATNKKINFPLLAIGIAIGFLVPYLLIQKG